jgi:hypothetical protein
VTHHTTSTYVAGVKPDNRRPQSRIAVAPRDGHIHFAAVTGGDCHSIGETRVVVFSQKHLIVPFQPLVVGSCDALVARLGHTADRIVTAKHTNCQLRKT